MDQTAKAQHRAGQGVRLASPGRAWRKIRSATQTNVETTIAMSIGGLKSNF